MANIDDRDVFTDLYFRFISLNYNESESHKQHVNALLDEFNSLDYKTLIIPDHTNGSQLITSCIKQVPFNDSLLPAKVSQLIVNLITRQHIQLHCDIIEATARWFVGALTNCSDIILCDILEGLTVILKGNAALLTKFHDCLISSNGLLTNLVDNKSSDNPVSSPNDITLLAVSCLEALVSINEDTVVKATDKPWISEQNINYCGDVFLRCLYKPKLKNQNEQNYCKIITSCLSGCRYIAMHPISWSNLKLGELLGVARTHMLRGIPNHEDALPQKVMPSQQPLPEVNACARVGHGGKVTKARKQRSFTNRKSVGAAGDAESNHKGYGSNINDSAVFSTTPSWHGWLKTSDSDFSDSECSQAARDRLMQGRTRQAALALLLSLVRSVNRRELFGYWHSLMPTGPGSECRSLCSCVLSDPAPKGRVAALAVLSAMIAGSRDYLFQAESSDKTPTAFTPFSVVLGNMITALHNILCLALSGESSLPVIVQMLKCLSLLVQNSPYHRLEVGLIGKLVRNVKGFARHRDSTVQVAALVVLGCVVAIEPVVPEVYEIISMPTAVKRKVLRTYSKNTLEFLKKSLPSQPIKLEPKITSPIYEAPNVNADEIDTNTSPDTSANTDQDFDEDFSDLSLNDIENSMSSDTEQHMSWLLEICLGNLGINKEQAPAPIQIESLQVLSVLGGAYFSLIGGHLDSVSLALGGALVDHYTESKLHAGRCLDSIGHAMNLYLLDEDNLTSVTGLQCAVFWQSLLPPISDLLQDSQNSSLRAVACDCLGNIGAEVFKHLAREKQLLIVTMLFGCARDDETVVRAAAVRALAIYVIFPELIEDVGFVMDTAEAVLRLMREPNVQVRIKASWSLGNLSNALINIYTTSDCEEIPNSLIMNLLRTSVAAAKDNDKIRSNAMRAVGNLLRVVKPDLLTLPGWKELVNEAISRLVKCTGTMKVRWNACYALGNVLKNNDLLTAGLVWHKSVFGALNDLVVNNRNFKVRLNAAQSLAVPNKREHYGDYYISVWTALVKALDNTSNMEDFNEYKHRDNLVNQVCLSLAHLTSLSTFEDLCPMQDSLIPHVDLVCHEMYRVNARLLPEKAGCFLSAEAHAGAFINKLGLLPEQISAVKAIKKMFALGDLSYDCERYT